MSKANSWKYTWICTIPTKPSTVKFWRNYSQSTATASTFGLDQNSPEIHRGHVEFVQKDTSLWQHVSQYRFLNENSKTFYIIPLLKFSFSLKVVLHVKAVTYSTALPIVYELNDVKQKFSVDSKTGLVRLQNPINNLVSLLNK